MLITNRKNIFNINKPSYNTRVDQINAALESKQSAPSETLNSFDEIAIAKKLFGKDFDLSVCENRAGHEKCNANAMPTKTTMDIYNYFASGTMQKNKVLSR